MYFLINLLIVASINQVLCINEKKQPLKVFYNLDEGNELFVDYVEKFGKVYEDEKEYTKRQEIFISNLKMINDFNTKYSDTVFGINQFSDITYEELSKFYMGVSGNFSNEEAIPYIPTGFAPDELDYRKQGIVTQVKQQDSCGACFSFSAIANIESQYAKKYRQLVILSEQQGLDCDPTGTCSGGQAHSVMQALAQQGGAMKGADYPYENQKGTCRTVQSKIAVKVTGGNRIGVNEASMKDALANYGPLSVYVNTCPEFQRYTTGIFQTANCAGTLHAVLLVGYGKDGNVPYWIIKNSWDLVWGEQGYMRLKSGQGICNIGTYAATATVA